MQEDKNVNLESDQANVLCFNVTSSLVSYDAILFYTYDVVTGGAKGVGAAHIHGGIIHFVQGSNVVPAFHLQQDPSRECQGQSFVSSATKIQTCHTHVETQQLSR